MSDALRAHVTPGATPQTEPANDRQVQNNAGGYTFKVDDRTRLNRFLTIGTEGGTYYSNEKPLTRDNAKTVIAMAEASNPLLIDDALEISEAGRAPRNNPALFALAAAAGLGVTNFRANALDLLPRVARTGSHLLTWAAYIEMFRGWGPQLTKGVGRWYTSKNADDLAYQLLKYKQRNGWSQADLIKLSHFGRTPLTGEQKVFFEYIKKGSVTAENIDRLPYLVALAEQAHHTRNTREWVQLIGYSKSLSWEMLPSEALAEADVWKALVDGGNLPLTALLRNLSRLTRLGVLRQMDPWTTQMLTKLTDAEYVTKSRIHPIQVLIALKTYAAGHSLGGGRSTWTPVPQVTEALNTMFYLAFGNVTPSGKRVLIGVDVSDSMDWDIAGYAFTAREVAGALALMTMKTEPAYGVVGFGSTLTPLNISPSQRLDDVMQYMRGIWPSGTDASIPIMYALQQNYAVDTFQVITDNETWAGRSHPHEALKQYRRQTGIDAKLQVIAVSPTDFSIADPLDKGMLDVSGMDSGIPALLAAHGRGEL
jgi:60 kDa SS-A/Ro ribonucleoprotein